MKCILRGYFARNFGDDLIIKTICESRPQVEFIAPVTGEDSQLPECKNLHTVRLDSPLNRAKKLASGIFGGDKTAENELLSKVDMQLYAGGSIFQQNKWWHENYEKFRQRLVVPTYVTGASFGPVRGTEMNNAYRPLFEKCADVAFRDDYSVRLFDGVKTVRRCCDTAEYFNYPDYKEKSESVIISVISRDNPSSEYDLSSYENGIAKWCSDLINAGYSVTLAAFCQREGDLEAAKRIQTISQQKTEIICYDGNLNEIIEAIGSAKYVIATRFHAALVAKKMSRKVIPIIYHTKQREYYKLTNAITADNIMKENIYDIIQKAEIINDNMSEKEK